MKNADSYCFQKVLSDKDLHCFLGFLALIRVNLRNPWLMTCSTIVEDPLQIGPSFFQNKPNFSEDQNNRKLSFDKGLSKNCGLRRSEGQSQTKPIADLLAGSSKHEMRQLRRLFGMSVARRCPGNSKQAEWDCSQRRCCLLPSQNRPSPGLQSCERLTDIWTSHAISKLFLILKNNCGN